MSLALKRTDPVASAPAPQPLPIAALAARLPGFVAAPVFLAMALATGLLTPPPLSICGIGSAGLSLSSMPLMYGLMGLVHLGPWLRLIEAARGRSG